MTYTLSISDTSHRASLETALEVYDAVRRPVATRAVNASLRVGFIYELHPDYLPGGKFSSSTGPDSSGTSGERVDLETLYGGGVGQKEELDKVQRSINDIYGLQWKEMPEVEWLKAKEMLESRFAGP